MAKTSLINKQRSTPKFKARAYTRCRICFRNLALRGEIPGVAKASW